MSSGGAGLPAARGVRGCRALRSSCLPGVGASQHCWAGPGGSGCVALRATRQARGLLRVVGAAAAGRYLTMSCLCMRLLPGQNRGGGSLPWSFIIYLSLSCTLFPEPPTSLHTQPYMLVLAEGRPWHRPWGNLAESKFNCRKYIHSSVHQFLLSHGQGGRRHAGRDPAGWRRTSLQLMKFIYLFDLAG